MVWAKTQATLVLCQLLRLLIESVHYFSHAVDGLEGSFIGFVDRSLLEHNQNTFTLIQNATQLLVEDHL